MPNFGFMLDEALLPAQTMHESYDIILEPTLVGH